MTIKSLFVMTSLAIASLANAEVHVICRLAPSAPVEQIAATYGLRVIDSTAGAPFVLFSATDSASATVARNAMLTDVRVVWSEDDNHITSPEGQKGSTLPAVGGRALLQAANALFLRQIRWSPTSASASGRPVRVAILDTGLSPYIPALWSKVVASANFVEDLGGAFDQPTGTDSNGDGVKDRLTGHGSMVAGIVDQVSPQSQLIIARVADSDGAATTWRLIKGLAFAAVNGAEIANVSLGTLSQIPAMADVIDWTTTQNLTVVAAAGNNATNDLCYPARVRNAIAVGGLTATNTRASFSNWDRKLGVSAPAVGIASYDWTGNITIWSGTSFATPMVSGAIAEYLRFSRRTGTPSRISSALKSSVTNIDALNPANRRSLGGLLDVSKLITFANK